MKKNIFWKIMAVLFFLWLCVWLWDGNGRYQLSIDPIANAWRIDTKTGEVAVFDYTSNQYNEKESELNLKAIYPKK